MGFKNYLFRCSSLGHIMPRNNAVITKSQLAQLAKLESKSELTSKQKGELTRLKKKRDNPPEFDLSEGAKTFCKKIVKEHVLGFKHKISSRAMEKGSLCEDEGIRLYNHVNFTSYKKNTIRLSNNWLSGECDVWDYLNKVQDYKCSETKATFPLLPDEMDVGIYEWQGRGYMMLTGEWKFEIVYFLVNTPDEIIKPWEDYELHDVEDIEPEIRLTSLMFDRDLEKENLIKHKVKQARKYMNWYFQQVTKKYG